MGILRLQWAFAIVRNRMHVGSAAHEQSGVRDGHLIFNAAASRSNPGASFQDCLYVYMKKTKTKATMDERVF
jgi:hypothetical protein